VFPVVSCDGSANVMAVKVKASGGMSGAGGEGQRLVREGMGYGVNSRLKPSVPVRFFADEVMPHGINCGAGTANSVRKRRKQALGCHGGRRWRREVR
jgi:hypothetical protein